MEVNPAVFAKSWLSMSGFGLLNEVLLEQVQRTHGTIMRPHVSAK